MPNVIDVPIPLAAPYLTETAFSMKRQAGVIAGDDLRLQRPVPFGLGVRNQPVKQGCPDALPVRRCLYIDADLSDAGSASRVGNRRKRRPAG